MFRIIWQVKIIYIPVENLYYFYYFPSIIIHIPVENLEKLFLSSFFPSIFV